jgi:cyclomaltodextrinase / maltogenic alpha-amylase / neopullulanase
MNQEIKIGKYEHYKGKQYEVIGLARHSETLEELVVYKALYGEGDLWVRPADMFTETVEIEGETKPRFKYIGE